LGGRGVAVRGRAAVSGEALPGVGGGGGRRPRRSGPAPPGAAAPAVRAAGPASSLVAPPAPRYPDRRMSGFVHLHVHTEYSLADSIIRVPEKPDQADPAKAKRPNLLSRAVELGLPALAVTDLNNLFALIKFYKACEAVGIKPVA